MEMPEPVLVTGGTGFVGQPLVRALESMGLKVAGIGTRDADLRDPVECRRWIEGRRTVFHLAAKVGGIGANRRAPYAFWRDNLLMGMNVIEACREAGVEVLVVMGSVCAYPLVPPRIPFREDDLWMGRPEPTNEGYGMAKRILQVGMNAMTLEAAWDGREGKPIWAFPIPTNLYGTGEHFYSDDSAHVIPDLIRKFVAAKKRRAREVVLWGTGKPSRDFLYVDDAVAGLIACAKKVHQSQCYIDAVNLGSGREVSIYDLACLVAKIVGYMGAIGWDTSKPDGQPRRCIDSSRAKEILDWEPQVSLEEGLRKTVKWYLEEHVPA